MSLDVVIALRKLRKEVEKGNKLKGKEIELLARLINLHQKNAASNAGLQAKIRKKL